MPTSPDLNHPRQGYDWFMVVRNPVERVVSEYYCPWTGTRTPDKDTEDSCRQFLGFLKA